MNLKSDAKLVATGFRICDKLRASTHLRVAKGKTHETCRDVSSNSKQR